MAGHDRLTLLTATKRLDLSQAAVLADLLRARSLMAFADVGQQRAANRDRSLASPRRSSRGTVPAKAARQGGGPSDADTELDRVPSTERDISGQSERRES